MLTFGGPPLPSDAVAAVTAMMEEFKVEVQADMQNAISGNINKLMGRSGECVAGLEDQTAKIEGNMAAMSQAQQKQGAMMEHIMPELRGEEWQGKRGLLGFEATRREGRVAVRAILPLRLRQASLAASAGWRIGGECAVVPTSDMRSLFFSNSSQGRRDRRGKNSADPAAGRGVPRLSMKRFCSAWSWARRAPRGLPPIAFVALPGCLDH